MSKRQELTPDQSKEHMDELLELQVEEADLARKLATSAEKHKEAKAAHELKQGEIIKHLAALNQDLPLFDKTEELPWPFPVPEDTREATLANIAADPVVLGLTIGIVKQVREVLGVFTLSALELKLKAEKPLDADGQEKAKAGLIKLLGGLQAAKLLRGLASFTGNRKKAAGKKEKPAAEAKESAKEKPEKVRGNKLDWRLTKLDEIEELTPNQARYLGQNGFSTFGDVLDRFEAWEKESPEKAPANYLAVRLGQHLGLKTETAEDIVLAIRQAESDILTGSK